MRRLVALIVCVVLMTSCSDFDQGMGGSDPREVNVTLDDGRTITCITWKNSSAGGISCDWSPLPR